MDLEILKIWPDWQATRLLGEGSFGKVYEIVRNNFGIEEHCALKVISIPSSPAELQSMRNEGMDDASATAYYRGLVEEFVQEIALMSKLKGNVNVVGYEDYAVIEHKDEIGWDILIRMELLTALPEYMREHPFTADDVVKMAIDVCNALEVCHEQKIIHRDIKPDNIFISQKGDYKLGDFGVARTIEKTVSGLSKKGTYTYMAPEVYKGEPYGTNVDLYSLGIVMYKLLNNNREPFLPPYPEIIKYSDKNDALVRRLNGEVIPAPANCSDALGSVILKAISFHSWERYQRPGQMKGDLQTVRNHIGVSAAPIIQADQMGTAKSYQPSYSQNYPQPSPPTYTPGPAPVSHTTTSGGGAFVFGEDSQAPHTPMVYQQPAPLAPSAEKKGKNLATVGTVFGWLGAPLWLLALISIDPIMFVFSLVVTACMVTLSIRKMEPYRKVLSITMLVFSVVTVNILNIVASILFLCAHKVLNTDRRG